MREKTGRLSKLNTPAIAGLWYTLSSVIERGSAVILTPIYTRLLLPDAYGVYSLYISILGIVGIFATLEISGSAVYRGLAEFEDKDRFIVIAGLEMHKQEDQQRKQDHHKEPEQRIVDKSFLLHDSQLLFQLLLPNSPFGRMSKTRISTINVNVVWKEATLPGR